jgi:integrase
VEATRLLAGVTVSRLSDALEVYLTSHPKRNRPKFVAFTRRSFGKLTAVVGDKPIADVDRQDGHALVTKMQAVGFASSSIRRDLNVIRAVMKVYFLEKKINQLNPFSSIPIPDEGEDAEDAVPYNTEELAALVAASEKSDDDPRWLLAMIADTGARLAEVTGLCLDDIDLEAETPHIVIKAHPWRSLKNKGSAREVPLVGHALWAAKRVKETAKEAQRFAFPRYTTETKTNANSASAALNKWIKETVKLPHTVHELRHTMADRLREVECPQDLRMSIGGWSLKKSGGVGEGYGKGYRLRKMAEWLRKVVSEVQG